MNKAGIVGVVAARTGLSRAEAAGTVDAVFEAVTEALGRRGEIEDRRVRPVRHPRTGEPVPVAASTAPTFKPAKALREAVNAGIAT